MDFLADVALLMGLLHVQEELVLPKEVLVAKPARAWEASIDKDWRANLTTILNLIPPLPIFSYEGQDCTFLP